MQRPIIATAAIAAAIFLAPLPGATQVLTELRDPVRGVSFHSVELSNQPLSSLDVIEGTFSDSDSLTVGLSAMSFDGHRTIDEYVLWIRHEGRRWLEFELAEPITVIVNGNVLPLTRLRAAQPFVGSSGRVFEKIEFGLSPQDVQTIRSSDDVLIRLSSDNGVVEQRLTATERERIARFEQRVLTDMAARLGS